MASWRDAIKVPTRFRGVPFFSVDTDVAVGRRTVLHEYPQRDDPYTEDLGRRARQFRVDGYVLGDNYLDQRNELIKAFEEPGPGELNHPRYGVLWVAVLEVVSIKETSREGGIARFSVTFVEHGANQFPTTVQDTVSQVDVAAAQVEDAAADDFVEAFDVSGPEAIAADTLRQLERDMNRMVDIVRQYTSTEALGDLLRDVVGVSDALVDLIRTPTVLAQSLISLFGRFSLAVRRPLSAIAELQAVFGRNARIGTGALSGSTLARRQVNEVARADLQRRIALAQQGRVLAIALTTSDLTANQARALRDTVLAQIDTEVEVNDPPAAVVGALDGLRLAITRDVQARAELLRESSTFTPVAVLPSLVLAHRIYQDATRADELVLRNAVRHPAFVPAVALEVLR